LHYQQKTTTVNLAALNCYYANMFITSRNVQGCQSLLCTPQECDVLPSECLYVCLYVF